MITSTIGTATVTHEPDWSDVATISYKGVSYQMPGELAYLLINSNVEMVTLQKDFEALRRQAGAFRTTMAQMFDGHESRIKALEPK